MLPQVNSALHPSGVAKSSTSFGWGNGGNVTSAGWQVTLCDPIWHVSSRSGEAFREPAIHHYYYYYYYSILCMFSIIQEYHTVLYASMLSSTFSAVYSRHIFGPNFSAAEACLPAVTVLMVLLFLVRELCSVSHF